MKRTSAIAHFRRLCCLGLQPQVVMPSLLAAVHEVLPSETNGFFWADDEGHLAGFTPEYVIPGVVATLMENFEGVVERALPISFSATMLRGNAVGNLLPFFTGRFYRGETYNLIYRPYALHHCIDGIVRDTPTGRGLGAFVVGRSAQQPEFSAVEQETLAQLLPYIAHAMHPPDAVGSEVANNEFSDSGDSGLVVLDRRADIAYISARAREILFLATHAGATPWLWHDSRTPHGNPTMRPIMDVFANLVRISEGQGAPAPVAHYDGPFGRFVFRAHWLEPADATAHALVGVSVQHQEPTLLVMMRNMRAAGLSDKEAQVCLLLQQNQSFAVIAERLHISLATAKDYADRLYRKLDVHTRQEALRKLLH